MKRLLILEKFGISIRFPVGLDDLKDKTQVTKITEQLLRKRITVRESGSSCYAIIGSAELANIQSLINGKRNRILDSFIAKQFKLISKNDELLLMFFEIVIAKLTIIADTKTKRFMVIVDNDK